MFTNKDFEELIDKNYFVIISQNSYEIELQSKNTKHFWSLLNREYNNISSIVVYSSHYSDGDYHLHCHAINLEQAILFIKNNDRFYLESKERPMALG